MGVSPYTSFRELDSLIQMCPDREEPVDPLYTPRNPKPAGRKEQIRLLRSQGLQFEDIALRVGMSAGGARNAIFRMKAQA